MKITFDGSGAISKLNVVLKGAPEISRSGAWAAAKTVRDEVIRQARDISYSGNPSRRYPSFYINIIKNGLNMGDAIYAAYSRDRSTADSATYHVSWRKSGGGLPSTRLGIQANRGRILISERIKGQKGKIWIDLTRLANAHPFLKPALAASRPSARRAAEKAIHKIVRKKAR